MCQWRVALIITFGWIVHIDNVVWCRETSLGTSFQQNHPNHVLSTMGIRKGPMETMEPSLATPQTGKLALLCCTGWALKNGPPYSMRIRVFHELFLHFLSVELP